MTERNITYICNACGWVYDPEQGDPDGGIAPGTQWEDIPDDWVCPVCGVSKEDFERVESAPDTTVDHESRPAGSTAPLVIIGSGLAGYSLARELRKRDGSMQISIITSDGGEAYSKPMLSNAFARNHQADDMVQKDALTMVEELGIDIITNTQVLEIDRNAQQLKLQGYAKSSNLNYDRLVLALGADPRLFPVEGQELVGISTVNDLEGYRQWREKIKPSEQILLIGAGLIGCEFANDLSIAGFKVSIIDPAAWPLARLLPEEIGNMLIDALETEGCSFYLHRTVARYTRNESGFQAELDNGETVNFDHALSAVGLVPRIDLASEAGLDVEAGIIVDRTLRTNDPLIFALGDCAQTEAGLLPFIAPLLAEARVLADTLTGNETELHLPAMPVVVKTPVLPLIICPPPAGIEGNWTVVKGDHEAVALYQSADGTEVGFALAGGKTELNKSMAKRMPDLLPVREVSDKSISEGTIAGDMQVYECDVCSYIYDPKEGDPDGGIAPGTAWEDIPDDWICPVCGAGKEEFTPLS